MTTGMAPDDCERIAGLILPRIDRNRDRSDAGLRERVGAPPECLERRARRGNAGRPQEHDRRLAFQRRERARPSGDVLQREVRRWKRLVQPGCVGGDAGDGGTGDDVVVAAERGARGSIFTSPDSTIRRRVFSGTSVKTCVSPEGHATVSFTMRSARAETDQQLFRLL